MTDYKSMYYALFNRVSKAIEDLQKIQQETEEMYMSADEKTADKTPESN